MDWLSNRNVAGKQDFPLIDLVTLAEYKNKNGCEQAPHSCYSITLLFYEHMNSLINILGIPPKSSKCA